MVFLGLVAIPSSTMNVPLLIILVLHLNREELNFLAQSHREIQGSHGVNMEEHEQFDSTENINTNSFDLESTFSHFEKACERAFQERWFSAANFALNSPTGFYEIDYPPQAIPIIQSNGYKKWVDNPEYAIGKARADARAEKISEILSERFRAMESILIDYLRFILKCTAFRTMCATPFDSVDHIRNVLELRCYDYWLEYFDIEFCEWLDEFFKDLDLSSVITIDNRHSGAYFSDHTSFQQAIETARHISAKEGVEVVVERNNRGWVVLRQPAKLGATTASICDDGSGDDFVTDETSYDSDNDDYDKYADEARQEAIDEINDYADGLALSDSDGWFYPD